MKPRSHQFLTKAACDVVRVRTERRSGVRAALLFKALKREENECRGATANCFMRDLPGMNLVYGDVTTD